MEVEFVNAQLMARKHSGTFEVPTQDELNNLKPSNFVKVCAFRERFWVEIEEINDEIITGRIDNDLVMTDEIKFDDVITFKKENIYAIF